MPRLSLNSFRRAAFAVVSLILIMGATGSGFGASGATNQAPPRNSANYDAYLNKEIHRKLVTLPFYSVFDNLEYKIDGSKVTLFGQVVRASLKIDAGKSVKQIEGVETVDNQIEVLPVSTADSQIRRAEYKAIYSFPSLQRYKAGPVPPIHIIVKNGHVTLEGVVDTQSDKDAANLAASRVHNVFSVTNNLRVENGK